MPGKPIKLLHPTEMNTEQTIGTSRLSDCLGQAHALRQAGDIEGAVACGPSILEAYFFEQNGYPLNRQKLSTFNEKLYDRMLRTHAEGCAVYSRLSDKLAVRDHVAATIGERYLTPLIWSGEHAEDIPWDNLPEQSMLKCNEGSSKNAKLIRAPEKDKIIACTQRWQAESYYWFRREYHYWEVPRRLMIEALTYDAHEDGPLDYVFYCFDGVPQLIQVGSRSQTIHRFYLPAWQPVQLSYRQKFTAPTIPRPSSLEEMLQVAHELSAPFDFVRIDLYSCHGRVVFGEMTFTPRAGNIHFKPPEWNERLGQYWNYAGIPAANPLYTP
jgi:hypothetical protein